MNTFIDILFIFLFTITLFFFDLPNIKNNDFLIQKVAVFISLFIFTYILNTIKKVRNKCKVEQKEIISDSFFTTLVGVIGYSIYIDLTLMEWSKVLMEQYAAQYPPAVIASVVITLSITFVKVLKILFTNKYDECIMD